MVYKPENNFDKELLKSHDNPESFLNTNFSVLKPDCGKCFGLCCVALYFSASEGFPTDKDAGTPCLNLQHDFRCSVHNNLEEHELKGCIAYDCFGAGQKVAQVTYSGRSWQQASEFKEQMFEVFLIMQQLHEMLWYLTQALTLEPAESIYDKLIAMLNETEHLTQLNADSLIELDLAAHRSKINTLLVCTSELVRAKTLQENNISSDNRKLTRHRLDFIGADLRKTNLIGANLRGAYLIAADIRGVDLSGADLLGTDLRDTDLRGANLKDSIFLTQSQINTAKGDSSTKLPLSITRPKHWYK